MDNTSINQEKGTGYLVVKVSTARGAIPLANAAVSIRGEDGAILYSLKTDRDGISPKVSLPTPSSLLSQSPEASAPYSLWNIDVFKDGYASISFQNVPVYPDIVSVQPAVMIPNTQNYTAEQIVRESGDTLL